MTRTPRPAALTAALALSLGTLSLTGCTSNDEQLAYQADYANHQPLRTTGYPTVGSLRTVQQIVWHLADRDADALAALDTETEMRTPQLEPGSRPTPRTPKAR
ncbi:hypothetical protein HFP43_32130 [Streptomyces sp. SJ1-7]|nr:hypothetical protein [Streptomyces sp. SJ1-7]